MVYADTSFFVPLYQPDAHSPEARRRITAKPAVSITPFHRAEISNALFNQVFRGKLVASEASLAWQSFEADVATMIWNRVEIPDGIWETSIDLARRFAPALGVRTLDSLHVACALELSAQRFWTFDERQARLAEAVGLITTA
jgi:predicted nucleic acid-binding protein